MCPPPQKKSGISVNPIWTKGADYARHITTAPPHLFGRCGVSGYVCDVNTQTQKSLLANNDHFTIATNGLEQVLQ